MFLKFKKTLAFLFLCTSVFSQSLEPRLYSNAPIGMNFLVLGYAYTNGSIPDNTNLELEDADLDVEVAIAAYAHVFKLFGQSGKIDIIVPTGCIDGTASVSGATVTRDICGMGDIKTRISLNLFGAPALSLKEFATYKQDLIIGVSVQVTFPTGQYEKTKLVNLGANRYAIKPSLGISKAINDVTLEFSGAVEFYSSNDKFWNGNNKRKQAPIYSTQAHILYNFRPGLWLGLDANYYWGGESTLNGVKKDDKIADSRYGATLSLPINKKNSVKIYGNSGISTRTGTDFDMLGFAWQYRFGGGL